MKNSIIEMKIIANRINSRLDRAEEQTSKFEDIAKHYNLKMKLRKRAENSQWLIGL